MDQSTISYYNKNYKLLSEKYSSGFPEYINLFKQYFSVGSTVLDIGSGSGRDLNILTDLGYNAFGIEPSKPMIMNGFDIYKNIEGKVYLGSLPDSIPKNLPYDTWDNILSVAVLQHIPDSKLFDTLFNIHELLKTNGILLISIPTMYPNITGNRDINERLFQIRSNDEYLLILQIVGFTLIHETINSDALNRDDTEWTTLVLKKN